MGVFNSHPPSQLLLRSLRLRVVKPLCLRSQLVCERPRESLLDLSDYGTCTLYSCALCPLPCKLALRPGSWVVIRDNLLHSTQTSSGSLNPPPLNCRLPREPGYTLLLWKDYLALPNLHSFKGDNIHTTYQWWFPSWVGPPQAFKQNDKTLDPSWIHSVVSGSLPCL